MQTAISQIEASPDLYVAQNNFSAELEKQQPSTQLTIIKDLLKKHPDHPWLMRHYAFALSSSGDHLLAINLWLDGSRIVHFSAIFNMACTWHLNHWHQRNKRLSSISYCDLTQILPS